MKKLSAEQQAELIMLYKSGVSVKVLSRKYKRSVSTLYNTYLDQTVKNHKPNNDGLIDQTLEIHSEHDRKLFDWFTSYARECGLTPKHLIKLLILKEQTRALKGEK